MSIKKLTFFFILTCFWSVNAHAFRPLGHIVLQRSIAQGLPADNVFRRAMDSFPVFAAWGAIGPDLCYIPDLKPKRGFMRALASSANYADIAHYYKVGSFCRTLITRARASGDARLIAFAAGWMTHVAGDFGSHGIFVHPEAGYYIENPDTRDLHGELEQYAETVLFYEEGRRLHGSQQFDTAKLSGAYLYETFLGLGKRRSATSDSAIAAIGSFLESAYREVYGGAMHADFSYLMRKYRQSFGAGKGSWAGFKILPYREAKAALQGVSKRAARLDSAFQYARVLGASLLYAADRGDFSAFSDKWNLDVGPTTNTLLVETTVAEEAFSGSANRVFIDLYLNSRHEKPVHYNVKGVPVRYNRSDVLFTFFYLPPHLEHQSVLGTLRYRKTAKLRDRTVFQKVRVFLNGALVREYNNEIELSTAQPVSPEMGLPEIVFR